MNRKSIPLVACLLFGLTLSLSGCLYSIKPLYTEKDLVFLPELIGTWRDTKDNSTITITKLYENAHDPLDKDAYAIVSQADGEEQRCEARLVKTGKMLLLDIYPHKAEDKLLEDSLLPLHSFIKVEVKPEGLKMTTWNFEYLDEKLVHKKLQIPHVRINNAGPSHSFAPDRSDAVVLTATTLELQKVLKEIENDPKIFSNDLTFEYRRQQ